MDFDFIEGLNDEEIKLLYNNVATEGFDSENQLSFCACNSAHNSGKYYEQLCDNDLFTSALCYAHCRSKFPGRTSVSFGYSIYHCHCTVRGYGHTYITTGRWNPCQ